MIRSRVVFSILSVVLMLSVSVLVPVFSESDATMEDEASVVFVDDPEYGFIPLIIIAGYTGKALITAFVGGFAIGFIAGLVVKPNEQPAGSNEEIYKMAREMYANARIDSFNTAVTMASSILPADTSLWAHTTNYWERNSELVVSALWSDKTLFKPDRVYELTLMRENVENYIYDWQSALDKAYNTNLSARQYFSGDCYGDMNFVLEWTGGSMTASNDPSVPFVFDMTQIVRNAKSGQYVWVDCDGIDEGGTYESTSRTMYNFGNNTLTLTKVAVLDKDSVGNTISIPGKSSLDLSGKVSGLYRIDTADATFAGPITPSATDNTPDVGGTLVFTSGDDMIYAIPNGDAVTVVDGNGKTISSSSLKISVDFTGSTTSKATTDICDLAGLNLVRDWDNLLKQIWIVQDRSTKAGETIWGIFDVAESSSSFISPSSVTSSVIDVSMSVQEQQAIYVQAMVGIADYWKQSGGKLTEAEFVTSLDSSDLIVYGDIYYNGSLWMENAIFTPYMSVSSSQVLTVGQVVDWSGAGMAMMWAQEDNFDRWDKKTTAGNQLLLSLDSSYSIDVKRIEKSGTSVSSFTLNPTVIKKFTRDQTDPIQPVDPPKVLDATTMIMIILVELAAILFLICYILGSPVAGLILALIVLAIAVFFSGTIASIFLGTFSWIDLLPFTMNG